MLRYNSYNYGSTEFCLRKKRLHQEVDCSCKVRRLKISINVGLNIVKCEEGLNSLPELFS